LYADALGINNPKRSKKEIFFIMMMMLLLLSLDMFAFEKDSFFMEYKIYKGRTKDYLLTRLINDI
jgi:hypothetical protein